MKSLTILAFWILLLVSPIANTQEPFENFPSLETVYKQLDKQLTIPCEACYFELAKKKDGYYVGVVSYYDANHDSVEYAKIWDAATKQFLTTDLKEYVGFGTMNESMQKGHEGIKQKQRECDFNYLYGYENYTTDLINYLENKSNLKTNELEMLARAYSTEATNFIHPNISGAYISESKNLPTPDYEKVSPERINSFLEKANKSISYYEKIKQIDPDYKPFIIEGLDLKLNEDLMHYYLTMKAVKEDALAQSFLDRVHFSESEIIISKLILDACEQGSVYLPAGDTDSYPLWYVQEKLNYRKDISIIHSILLYNSWYFDYVKQNCPAKFSLTLDEHKTLSNEIVMLSESIDEIPTYDQWIRELRVSMADTKDMDYLYVTGVVSFDGKKGTFSLMGEKDYFSIIDFTILDLIASNPDRKIYVAHPDVFENFDVNGYFVWRGPLFEFSPENHTEYWDEESLENLEINLNNPAIQFSVNSSPFDLWLFESWATTLAYMHQSAPNGYNELYATFKKKVDMNEVIKANQQRTLDPYETLIEVNSSVEHDEFLKLYTPTSLKMLKEISETKTLTAKDLATLVFIQEMYIQNHYQTSGKDALTTTEKKVIKELKTKIDILLALKINQDNLDWSYDRLQYIQELLAGYEF